MNACWTCGMTVAEREVTSDGDRWFSKLVHVDHEGNTVFKWHNAVVHKCAKCDHIATPGAETYTGKPACYYHEDKISYLARTQR